MNIQGLAEGLSGVPLSMGGWYSFQEANGKKMIFPQNFPQRSGITLSVDWQIR